MATDTSATSAISRREGARPWAVVSVSMAWRMPSRLYVYRLCRATWVSFPYLLLTLVVRPDTFGNGAFVRRVAETAQPPWPKPWGL